MFAKNIHPYSTALLTLVAASCLTAADAPPFEGFLPGNLVVSRSVYMGTASTVTVGQPLPPNCPATAACSKPATNDGSYPNVFNNAAADGSFGVTSPIFLDQLTPEGTRINSMTVPTSLLVTSLPSAENTPLPPLINSETIISEVKQEGVFA